MAEATEKKTEKRPETRLNEPGQGRWMNDLPEAEPGSVPPRGGKREERKRVALSNQED